MAELAAAMIFCRTRSRVGLGSSSHARSCYFVDPYALILVVYLAGFIRLATRSSRPGREWATGRDNRDSPRWVCGCQRLPAGVWRTRRVLPPAIFRVLARWRAAWIRHDYTRLARSRPLIARC